jgi:phosphoribosylamine--glycine ligase
MLVSKGYPDTYEKGKVISGEELVSGSLIFHAGTRLHAETNEVVSDGGRVIAVTSLYNTKEEALARSYKNADLINFEGKNFRPDIGFDLT